MSVRAFALLVSLVICSILACENARAEESAWEDPFKNSEFCKGTSTQLTGEHTNQLANNHRFPSVLADDWTYVQDIRTTREECEKTYPSAGKVLNEILFPLDPSAERALELVKKTNEVVTRTLKAQRESAERISKCAARSGKGANCEDYPAIKQELQRRLLLMRLSLAASDLSVEDKNQLRFPKKLKHDAPMIAHIVPTFWFNKPGEIEKLSSQEEIILLDPEKANDPEIAALLKSGERSGLSQQEYRDIYYMVLNRTPVLAYFSKAEITDADIAKAYRDFLKQSEESASSKKISRTYMQQLPYVAQALTELPKEHRGDYCFFANRLLKDQTDYQNNFSKMIMVSGLGPYLGKIPVTRSLIARMTAGATASTTASGFQQSLNALENDEVCRRVAHEISLEKQGLCDFGATNETLSEAQTNIIAGIAINTGMGAYRGYKFLRNFKSK